MAASRFDGPTAIAIAAQRPCGIACTHAHGSQARPPGSAPRRIARDRHCSFGRGPACLARDPAAT
eukprot:11671553-Alexandrium_andersonii.AAC.1